jgi:hypothetical protein
MPDGHWHDIAAPRLKVISGEDRMNSGKCKHSRSWPSSQAVSAKRKMINVTSFNLYRLCTSLPKEFLTYSSMEIQGIEEVHQLFVTSESQRRSQ